MRKTTILILAYLPYYLNDFANILVTDYTAWVAVDYGVRIGILCFLFFVLWRGFVSRDDLMLGLPGLADFLVWTAGTTVVAMGFLYVTEFVLAPYYPAGSMGGVPLDTDSPLFMFDSTVGLVLVGISEEIVCRGLTLSVLRNRLSIPALYVVSALLFSLMHWSLSVHTLFDAFVYGLVFVPATLATGSIWPATVVHFLVNFVLYSM